MHINFSSSFRIVFTPTFPDVESAVLDTYDIMIKAANDVPRFEHYLDPDGTGGAGGGDEERLEHLKPTILPEIVDEMKQRVK